MKEANDEVVNLGDPVGLWGWNMIPFLNLVGAICICAHFCVTGATSVLSCLLAGEGESIKTSLVVLVIAECLMNFGRIVLSVSAILAMFRRKKAYVTLAKWVFWLGPVFVLADSCLGACADIPFDAKDCKLMGQGLLFAWIWTTYYNKSRRIRNTFTEPSQGKGNWLAAVAISVGLVVLWGVIKWQS